MRIEGIAANVARREAEREAQLPIEVAPPECRVVAVGQAIVGLGQASTQRPERAGLAHARLPTDEHVLLAGQPVAVATADDIGAKHAAARRERLRQDVEVAGDERAETLVGRVVNVQHDEWSRAGISWILKNDTYVGRVHFGKIRSKGRHESIVPPIVFNKVQKLIRENNKRKGGAEKAAISPVITIAPRNAVPIDEPSCWAVFWRPPASLRWRSRPRSAGTARPPTATSTKGATLPRSTTCRSSTSSRTTCGPSPCRST